MRRLSAAFVGETRLVLLIRAGGLIVGGFGGRTTKGTESRYLFVSAILVLINLQLLAQLRECLAFGTPPLRIG